VLVGDLSMLTAPTVNAADVARLVDQLAAGHRPDRSRSVELSTALTADADGRLYLPGLRGELPTASTAALAHDAAGTDASAVLWRVLIGAAATRWRCADRSPSLTGPRGWSISAPTDRVRARSLVGETPDLLARHAVWRAARGVAEADRRPTGLDALPVAVRRYQQTLDAQVQGVSATPTPPPNGGRR